MVAKCVKQGCKSFTLGIQQASLQQGVSKETGDNLKVIWAEFSTLG
jgi:hypothetical protein